MVHQPQRQPQQLRTAAADRAASPRRGKRLRRLWLLHLQPRPRQDQFRLVTQLRSDYYQIPYDPNPNGWQNQLYDSSGLRDGEHETDGYGAFTWVHTFNSSTLLQVSPFYHYNSANYEPSPDDSPTATTSDRDRQLCRSAGLDLNRPSQRTP